MVGGLLFLQGTSELLSLDYEKFRLNPHDKLFDTGFQYLMAVYTVDEKVLLHFFRKPPFNTLKSFFNLPRRSETVSLPDLSTPSHAITP